MATKVRLSSGLIAWHCTDAEQKATWDIFDAYDREVSSPNYVHRTNDRFELPYNQLSEAFNPDTQIYTVEIRANGHTQKVRGKIARIQDNVNKAVQKAFNTGK